MATRNPTQRPAPTYSGPQGAYAGDVRPLDRPDLRQRARQAYGIAEVFSRISDATQQKATEEAVVNAQRDARTQGVSTKKITVMRGGKPTDVDIPVLNRKEGSGAVARAWNQAAEATYDMRISTATMQHISQAALDHPADPEGFRQSLEGWKQGIKDLIPPDLQANYEHDLYSMAQPLITRAETDLQRNIAHDQAVDAGIYQDELVGSLVVNSSLGPEGAAVSASQFNRFIEATQSRIGPFYSEADARADIHSVLQRAAAGSLQAQFEGAPNKQAMMDAFQSGKPVVSIPAVGEDGKVTVGLYDKDSLIQLVGAEKVQTLTNGLAVDIRMQDAEQRAAAAEARAARNEELAGLQTDIQLSFPDAVAEAEATGKSPMTASQIYAAYPGEKNRKTAEKLVAKLGVAAQTGSIRKTVAGQGPADDAAMLEAMKPKAGDSDFAERTALYNLAVQEVQGKAKALETDSASYVLQTSETVQNAWEAAKDNDPAKVKAAVAATKQAQIDLGVAPEKVQVMSKAQAQGLASTLNTAPPDTVAETLDQVTAVYGEDGTNQMIGEGASPMIKAAAFASDPALGAWRSDAIQAMKIPEADLKKGAVSRGVSESEISNALEGIAVPLQDTLPASASQPYLDAIRQVALYKIANDGMKPEAAAAYAWSAFEQSYSFNGTYRVPKKWDGDQVAGALSNVIYGLDGYDIAPAIQGFPLPSAGPEVAYPGQIRAGNIDLTKRPQVKNEDGTISTIRSITSEFDGKFYVLPTVTDDGRIVKRKEAEDLFLKGHKHLGIFNTAAEADTFAAALHTTQDAFYSARNFAKQETIEALRRGHYRWITDQKEQGVILTYEEGNPVLLENGEPLRIPFDAAMAMPGAARGGAVDRDLNKPGVQP